MSSVLVAVASEMPLPMKLCAATLAFLVARYLFAGNIPYDSTRTVIVAIIGLIILLGIQGVFMFDLPPTNRGYEAAHRSGELAVLLGVISGFTGRLLAKYGAKEEG